MSIEQELPAIHFYQTQLSNAVKLVIVYQNENVRIHKVKIFDRKGIG